MSVGRRGAIPGRDDSGTKLRLCLPHTFNFRVGYGGTNGIPPPFLQTSRAVVSGGFQGRLGALQKWPFGNNFSKQWNEWTTTDNSYIVRLVLQILDKGA